MNNCDDCSPKQKANIKRILEKIFCIIGPIITIGIVGFFVIFGLNYLIKSDTERQQRQCEQQQIEETKERARNSRAVECKERGYVYLWAQDQCLDIKEIKLKDYNK